jgi:hypothetical protein
MCNCGKKRTERLAAKRAVTASAAKPVSDEPRAFQPARWGKTTATPKEA